MKAKIVIEYDSDLSSTYLKLEGDAFLFAGMLRYASLKNDINLMGLNVIKESPIEEETK